MARPLSDFDPVGRPLDPPVGVTGFLLFEVMTLVGFVVLAISRKCVRFCQRPLPRVMVVAEGGGPARALVPPNKENRHREVPLEPDWTTPVAF